MIFDNNIPIYIQVIDDLKRRIIIGEIKSGEKLPSARELAIEYVINPNTAGRIYKELEQQEVCFTKRGLGTYVTEDEKKIETIRHELLEGITSELIGKLKKLGYSDEEIISEISKKLS